MQHRSTKRINSKNVLELLDFVGSECVSIAFNDSCRTEVVPAFIGQLNNALPFGMSVLLLYGSTDWGSAISSEYIEKQVMYADPDDFGAILIDHYRQLIEIEDADSTVYLKNYLDWLSTKTKIPLLVLHRYSL